MCGIPNPDNQGLRIENASSHAEAIAQGTGRQALQSQPLKATYCPQHFLQGMVKTGCHSYMPFSEMNPEEKLREAVLDELESGRLTFPWLIARGGRE